MLGTRETLRPATLCHMIMVPSSCRPDQPGHWGIDERGLMDIKALAYGEEWAPIFVFRPLRKDSQVDHAVWLGWVASHRVKAGARPLV